MLDHIDIFNNQPAETINYVYELPIVKPTIRYIHGTAGFPTNTTCLNIIRKGNYLFWPLIDVKNVHKDFPDSEETQKGHMQNQRQGVRSTKAEAPEQAAKSKHIISEKADAGRAAQDAEQDCDNNNEAIPIKKRKMFSLLSTTSGILCSLIKISLHFHSRQ